MKSTKILSKLFALAAAALVMAAAVGYGLFRNTPLMILTPVDRAENQTEVLMEALSRGDYAAAGNVMDGQPKLEWNPDQSSETSAILWKAFTGSISYEFSGGCYAAPSGICRDVTVTALDIPALIPLIQERFQQLLPQRVEEHHKKSEIYDENGNYQEAFVMDVLAQAAGQIVQECGTSASWNLTLELVHRDGQWWIVPDQKLIAVISGALT